jgi:hypothetical protein
MARKPNTPAKDAPCTYCGTVFSLRRLRCPKCHLEREDRPAPVSSMDRIAGVVMIGLGVVTASALSWFVYRALLLRPAVLFLVPGWLILHGGLLLAGVHLRDAHKWWNQRHPMVRFILQLLGIAAFVAFLWFLVTAARR